MTFLVRTIVFLSAIPSSVSEKICVIQFFLLFENSKFLFLKEKKCYYLRLFLPFFFVSFFFSIILLNYLYFHPNKNNIINQIIKNVINSHNKTENAIEKIEENRKFVKEGIERKEKIRR